MIPGSTSLPESVYVLPDAVCPYAKMTALNPSIAATTCERATVVKIGLFAEPVRMASKVNEVGCLAWAGSSSIVLVLTEGFHADFESGFTLEGCQVSKYSETSKY